MQSVKQLIVTADDVGLHRGMTEGAIRAWREGIVTACSIVANGKAFDDAVVRLREVPALEVGVHLALVEEHALTTGQPMPRNHVRFLLSRRRIDVERELRTQVERVLAAGLRVTHLNGHQHLHLLPGVFTIVVKLASEYGIGYIRIVDDRGGRGGVVRRASIGVLSVLGRRAEARLSADARPSTGRLPADRPAGSQCSHTIGVMEAGHLTADVILRLLDHVDGLTELVTHPGVGVTGYDWRYAWDAETHALCDPRLEQAIAERGIMLVAPSVVNVES
jgi:predicted glycoside hydrolase/deacetylase ChbG (UPF0249 family)